MRKIKIKEGAISFLVLPDGSFTIIDRDVFYPPKKPNHKTDNNKQEGTR